MGGQRRIAVLLLVLAGVAWALVLVVGMTIDPLSSSSAAFLGAAALGVATGLTAAPLFWLISFARHRRIAYRGDWLRAGRRGAWVGILVAIFVVMRANGILQPQIALFLVALALVAEVTLTAGGASRA
jgi:hypothetical protein